MNYIKPIILTIFCIILTSCNPLKFLVRNNINKDQNKHRILISKDDSTGQVIMSRYKKGIKSGTYISFYEDGQPAILGKYKNGRKNGKWNYYGKNGIVGREVLYSNDRIIINTLYNQNW